MDKYHANVYINNNERFCHDRIDLSREEVELDDQRSSLSIAELPGQVPDSSARYHLYRHDHHWQGELLHSVRKSSPTITEWKHRSLIICYHRQSYLLPTRV